MKKRLSLLVACLMTCILFFAIPAAAESAETGEWYGLVYGTPTTLTLNADGTYSIAFTDQEDGEITTGTWVLRENQIIVDEGSEAETAFAYDGESLTASEEGMTAVFTREPVEAFEPAEIDEAAAQDAFQGEWVSTMVYSGGMYFDSTLLLGEQLHAKVEGADVTIEEFPFGDTYACTFENGKLSCPPADEEAFLQKFELQMLKDGTIALTCMIQGDEEDTVFYLDPADAAEQTEAAEAAE